MNEHIETQDIDFNSKLQSLIGKQVCIKTHGSFEFDGLLNSYNGYMAHLIDGNINKYIVPSEIIAITVSDQ